MRNRHLSPTGSRSASRRPREHGSPRRRRRRATGQLGHPGPRVFWLSSAAVTSPRTGESDALLRLRFQPEYRADAEPLPGAHGRRHGRAARPPSRVPTHVARLGRRRRERRALARRERLGHGLRSQRSAPRVARPLRGLPGAGRPAQPVRPPAGVRGPDPARRRLDSAPRARGLLPRAAGEPGAAFAPLSGHDPLRRPAPPPARRVRRGPRADRDRRPRLRSARAIAGRGAPSRSRSRWLRESPPRTGRARRSASRGR